MDGKIASHHSSPNEKRRDLSQTAALISKKNYTLLIIKPNT